MSMFKQYDIRGNIEDQLTKDNCYIISQALCEVYHPKTVVIGYDNRASSITILNSLKSALYSNGVEVIDVGLVATEMVNYFSHKHQSDLGLMITGSHLNKYNNGIKITKQGGLPISYNDDMIKIKNAVFGSCYDGMEENKDYELYHSHVVKEELYKEYYDHLKSLVPNFSDSKLRIMVDASNGVGGHFIDYLVKNDDSLNIEVFHINFNLDGSNPDILNPLNTTSQLNLIDEVRKWKCDLGIAFDSDADRALFVNSDGVISPQSVTAILMNHLINKKDYNRFTIDNRSTLLPRSIARYSGADVYETPAGHINIKNKMISSGSQFGAETSGHYYYKDLNFSDSGFLTAMLMISIYNDDLNFDDEYVCSPEENYFIDDKTPEYVFWNMMKSFNDPLKYGFDLLDGLVIESNENWMKTENDFRISLRNSNTENLMRLNIESTTMDNDEFKSFQRGIDLIMKGDY